MDERAAKRMEVNGVALNVVDRGEGSPVLLLHGFPDSSALWRHQVPALVDAGFRPIAPDLRGFGESDRPPDVAAYRLENHVADMLGILDQLGIDRLPVVGHDWGAVVCWLLAALVPDRVERVAALSVGHPSGYMGSPRQREQSWYMLFFLLDQAEELIRAEDWRFLRLLLRGGDLERYLRDLARPGALTAALGIYRANVNPAAFAGFPTPLPSVRCPTMGIWSTRDRACGEEQMRSSGERVEGPWRYERVEGGHWIPVQAPDRLNELLLDFLA